MPFHSITHANFKGLTNKNITCAQCLQYHKRFTLKARVEEEVTLTEKTWNLIALDCAGRIMLQWKRRGLGERVKYEYRKINA